MANTNLVQAVIDAVDAIDKAMGEMSAASQSHVISPVGSKTSTAHVISPGALQSADDKVRAATQRLKDAVGNANGRMAGDPYWNTVAPPAAGPRAAIPAAKPSLFAAATAPKAPARPSWPGR